MLLVEHSHSGIAASQRQTALSEMGHPILAYEHHVVEALLLRRGLGVDVHVHHRPA